jgi:hypothetical protein
MHQGSVFGSVPSQWEVLNAVSVNVVIQIEQDAKASSRKGHVRRLK